MRHRKTDDCLPRTCKKCGRGGWRHDHKCGVRVCATCFSLDLKLKRDPDTTETFYLCLNCGGNVVDFISIDERLRLHEKAANP